MILCQMLLRTHLIVLQPMFRNHCHNYWSTHGTSWCILNGFTYMLIKCEGTWFIRVSLFEKIWFLQHLNAVKFTWTISWINMGYNTDYWRQSPECQLCSILGHPRGQEGFVKRVGSVSIYLMQMCHKFCFTNWIISRNCSARFV